MSNHFELPEGNVQISVSGGRTSGMMLHHILEANGDLPDRVQITFANTGREMPETLDFVQEMASRWNVRVTWLEYTRPDNKVSFSVVSHNSASRDGTPFEVLTASKAYLPNCVARFCTSELKIRTMKRFIVKSGWKHWTAAIGIRADESHRVKSESRDRWKLWYPLNDAGLTKRDVMKFWHAQPFDLQLGGKNGTTPLGNCDGCFLKSEATLAMMWREYPERMQWWADRESAIGSKFVKNRTYTDLGSFVEKQGDWIFNDQDYLCQEDGGECT